MRSLRGRLLALLLPALLAVTLAAAGSGYVTASRQLGGFLDTQLAESARVLLLWVLAEPRAGDEADAQNIERELVELFSTAQPVAGGRDGMVRQVRDGVVSPDGAAGRVPGEARGGAGRRDGAADARPVRLAYAFVRPGIVRRISSDPVLARAGVCDAPGLGEVRGVDGPWRVFTAVGGSPPATVCVAQPVRARRALILQMLLPSLGWWLLVLPATAVIVVYASQFGLAPLRDAVADLRGRAPGDLSPVPSHDQTREVRPLMAAMNDLLDRQRRLIEQERRFSAEAAHELRTPLTTMRLQAERALAGGPATTAQGGQGAEGAARRALAAILTETDRAQRVLSQLLTLARVDAVDAGGLRRESVRLMPLLREVLAEQATLGLERQVQLRLLCEPVQGAEGLCVVGDAVLLQVMLRNLVDNAVRYSPIGGVVTVIVGGAAAARPAVSVVDTGPGIAPELLRGLCEPFERGERHDESGTGLGLTIARRIARLHGAGLEMHNEAEGTGLRVIVSF